MMTATHNVIEIKEVKPRRGTEFDQAADWAEEVVTRNEYAKVAGVIEARRQRHHDGEAQRMRDE